MTSDGENNSWMLDLISPVHGVRHAVISSADGIARVWTDNTGRETAEWLAGACAGFSSLGREVSRRLGEGDDSRQVLVEYPGGFLFIRGAGDGSRLIVATEAKIDPKLVGQQMAAQVQQIGERTLSTPSRSSCP